MATNKRTSFSEVTMSQNVTDQEVEKRLKALEEKAHAPCGGGGVSADLAAKIEELWTWYQDVKPRI